MQLSSKLSSFSRNDILEERHQRTRCVSFGNSLSIFCLTSFFEQFNSTPLNSSGYDRRQREFLHVYKIPKISHVLQVYIYIYIYIYGYKKRCRFLKASRYFKILKNGTLHDHVSPENTSTSTLIYRSFTDETWSNNGFLFIEFYNIFKYLKINTVFKAIFTFCTLCRIYIYIYKYIYIYIYIYIWLDIGIMVRVFTNGLGDLGSRHTKDWKNGT